MSEVHVEILKHEPTCQYCGVLPASHAVTIKGKGEQEDARYLACYPCMAAVQDGLHECSYDCDQEDDYHRQHYPMPADPHDQQWLRERLLREDPGPGQKSRVWQWLDAGSPPLREENGRIVWDTVTPPNVAHAT
ncbi:MAG TPA: hypothetical protein VD902_21760 [Symbiobacteriaceae bacterium]|nr:hypothetical protein [Symbiobacteriaceae bacterium]